MHFNIVVIICNVNLFKLLDDISEQEKMKAPSADPVIGFITKAIDDRIAKTAMVPPPIVDPSPEGQNYHAQSVINRTDILTWTSNKGHTNQVSGRDGQSTDSK